jgi:quercetin dioxygenase-like cupin family protein
MKSQHIRRKIGTSMHRYHFCLGLAIACYVTGVTPAHADPAAAQALAKEPGVIFAHELADVTGKNLVVVKLEFPPKSAKDDRGNFAHRHPGSTYVYVIKGAVRLKLEGQPVTVVHAGESFFEPVGAVHMLTENASTTEPALALAVGLVPDGAHILTPVEAPKK